MVPIKSRHTEVVPIVEFESTQADPMYLYGHVWACSLSVESTGIALCSPSPQPDLTGGYPLWLCV